PPQGGKRERAVVETAGVVGRQRRASGEREGGIREPSQPVTADAVIQVRPETARLAGHGTLEMERGVVALLRPQERAAERIMFPRGPRWWTFARRRIEAERDRVSAAFVDEDRAGAEQRLGLGKHLQRLSPRRGDTVNRGQPHAQV